MPNLSTFSLTDMTRYSARLRKFGETAGSLEEVAGQIVRFLYDDLQDDGGERACVMVRFYKTHPFGALEPDLQQFAATMLGEPPSSELKCLTLLGTVGATEEWCDRRRSQRHRAIPLASPAMVAESPMIHQLVEQFGLGSELLLSASPELLLDLSQRTYNVFYVPEALGSASVPAQDDFVVPWKVQSVLGFGGVLPDGELFAVILFSRVPIPRPVADLFKPMALAVKLSLMQPEAVFA